MFIINSDSLDWKPFHIPWTNDALHEAQRTRARYTDAVKAHDSLTLNKAHTSLPNVDCSVWGYGVTAFRVSCSSSRS
jgi:hypothetical protein